MSLSLSPFPFISRFSFFLSSSSQSPIVAAYLAIILEIENDDLEKNLQQLNDQKIWIDKQFFSSIIYPILSLSCLCLSISITSKLIVLVVANRNRMERKNCHLSSTMMHIIAIVTPPRNPFVCEYLRFFQKDWFWIIPNW